MIIDLFEGENLYNEQFLVLNFNKIKTSKGQDFAKITLSDASGIIDANKWRVDAEDMFVFKPGNIVSIIGEVTSFNGNLQITVSSARIVDPSNIVDYSKFVQQSKLSKKELEDKFNLIVSYIKDEDYLKVINDIYIRFNNEIYKFPAAKTNHHNYLRGLITHTISMAETAYFLGNKYNNVNADILITGALLHDIGKIYELSGPIATTYTTEGGLIGHISLGFYIVKETCERLKIDKEKSLLLQHMILSHHGKLEFGSPVLPATKEALMLSMIDDLDAKVELADNILKGLNPGDFSSRLFALDDRMLYKPKK